MTTSTLQIDLDVLDELFNNQKKLDEMALFDDEFLFGGSSTPSQKTQNNSPRLDTFGSTDDFSYSDNDITDVQSRSMTRFIAPVILEMAALYYGITYFT